MILPSKVSTALILLKVNTTLILTVKSQYYFNITKSQYDRNTYGQVNTMAEERIVTRFYGTNSVSLMKHSKSNCQYRSITLYMYGMYRCSCWLRSAMPVNCITSGRNLFLLCVKCYKIDDGAVLYH